MNRNRADETKWTHWRGLMAEAARSGVSIREFCRRQRVTEAQFYAWRARLSGRRQGAARRRAKAAAGSGSTFALVSTESGGLERVGVELVLGDGRRLRIAAGVEEATLRAVLSALEPARC